MFLGLRAAVNVACCDNISVLEPCLAYRAVCVGENLGVILRWA